MFYNLMKRKARNLLIKAISSYYKVFGMIVDAKEGFVGVLEASSLPKLGRISSYLFIKWQKPANKSDSNMPKGTLNHLVLVNWKIYTNIHYLQRKRTNIHKIILDIFYSFSRNIKRITPFNISFKMKWQKDWVICMKKLGRKIVR